MTDTTPMLSDTLARMTPRQISLVHPVFGEPGWLWLPTGHAANLPEPLMNGE